MFRKIILEFTHFHTLRNMDDFQEDRLRNLRTNDRLHILSRDFSPPRLTCPQPARPR